MGRSRYAAWTTDGQTVSGIWRGTDTSGVYHKTGRPNVVGKVEQPDGTIVLMPMTSRLTKALANTGDGAKVFIVHHGLKSEAGQDWQYRDFTVLTT